MRELTVSRADAVAGGDYHRVEIDSRRFWQKKNYIRS